MIQRELEEAQDGMSRLQVDQKSRISKNWFQQMCKQRENLTDDEFDQRLVGDWSPSSPASEWTTTKITVRHSQRSQRLLAPCLRAFFFGRPILPF